MNIGEGVGKSLTSTASGEYRDQRVCGCPLQRP